MANYYTQFSCLIGGLTDAERAWLNKLIGELNEELED
jgi:hypothetical protein